MTLLDRVRDDDQVAWERLLSLYGSLVFYWCRGCGLDGEDLNDVAQEVFSSVAANIHGFTRERDGHTFRGWLRTITKSRIADHFRRKKDKLDAQGGTDAQMMFQQVPGPGPDGEDQPSVAIEKGIVLRRAAELIKTDFEETTWKAFWCTVVDERKAADVAADLHVSVNAIYKAKARVLQRLREELGSLID